MSPAAGTWTLDGPAVARLDPSPAWYMREGTSSRAGSVNFAWPRVRTWDVARRRYFDARRPRGRTTRSVAGLVHARGNEQPRRLGELRVAARPHVGCRPPPVL